MPRGMRDTITGMLGDTICVNGRPDFRLAVSTRIYRLRILNGSNARIYKLAWKDGTPLTVIGTDGGLLEKPVQRRYAMLGPGERLELWADFSKYPDGMQFQVLERSGVGHEGYVDEGWKDTVLLMPGERVRLLVRFSDYPGLFLYHCHNLEHEDMGMMRNYLVENPL